MFKVLDCFCGLGGTSEGFLAEGFTVHGIEINPEIAKLCYDNLNAKYLGKITVQVADMLTLKGSDFKGYDVIWGSPPCRDFSQIGVLYGKKWKDKPNPENGIATIRSFLQFVKDAQPTYWILENVALLKKYFKDLEPRTEGYITLGKRHVFYGNYPLFLMPRDMRIKTRKLNAYGRDEPSHDGKLRSWIAARIPLACSRAFARACKEALEEHAVNLL